MDKKEYEEIEKSSDILEHNASTRCNTEIQKAHSRRNGMICVHSGNCRRKEKLIITKITT
jgi:hypothetical protein